MFCWNLLACVFLSVTPNLLSTNGSFEQGLEAWESAFAPPVTAEALSLAEQDARAVSLLVKDGREATLRSVQPPTPGAAQ